VGKEAGGGAVRSMRGGGEVGCRGTPNCCGCRFNFVIVVKMGEEDEEFLSIYIIIIYI